MNTKRAFYLLIGLLVAIVGLGIATIVMGNLVLQKKAKELTALKLDNAVLDEQQNALVRANKDLEKYADLEKTAQAIVPQDKDQARAVREIVQIAAASGIGIRSITFPASNLGAGNTTSPGDAATKSAISQAKPVPGLTGVLGLEMTITPETTNRRISYNQFLDFLSKLETNRRTAQVTSIKIDPVTSDPKNSYVTFSLTINIFLRK